MGEPVDLDEVSLDVARYATLDMEEALVDLMRKRQTKWQPDLAVSIGSPAGIFVARHRERLFPASMPIIYAGMDQRRLPAGALEQNATFVGESFDVPGLVEDILQIAPDTNHIAVVIGATPLEHFWTETIQKECKPFESRVRFTFLNDLSLDGILERTKKLPPRSFILVVLMMRDASGVTHNADEVLKEIHAVANAPINGLYQHQLGLGIVGGRLYQGEAEGIEAAHIAIRLLRGEPVSNFPPKIMPALPPRYDARELQKWNIDEKQLPLGSTILFRTPTVWQQYRGWIIGAVSVCAAQAVLLSALVANHLRRRRAERSLSESERRFQTMADAAPVMIWVSGLDKRFTFFNQAWISFTGRTMERELGEGWSEGVHRDDLTKCLESYSRAFDARERVSMQYRLRRHDGDYRWITEEGVPRHNASGDFRGYVGVCVDITDLLKKDRALHDFEERVTLAAEAAHLGVWELNTTTYQVWLSDKARELFEFDAGTEITHAILQSRVHPDDRSMRESTIKQAISENGVYEVEYRILRPDGTTRWISGRGRCVADEEGQSTRLIGVSMDVTERKEAQELIRLATEASSSGTLLVDESGRIVLVNAHVEELFGYRRDELVGAAIETLLPERFAAYRAELTTGSEAQSSGAGRELFGRRKDGSEFPVEVGLNSVQMPRGMLILVTVVDITPRKLAAEEARHQREQIELLGRASLLGEMTASLAHELGQPLAAIVANASAGARFIDGGKTESGTLREIFCDIGADGRRARDIILNVRNTIKNGSTLRGEVAINRVVENVVVMVRPDAAACSCEVQTALAENLPLIKADPVQMQQVFINLVSNAFHAMRETPMARRKVEIATEQKGADLVRVTVRDHGPGIPVEMQERLFEQFYTTRKEGLGMGLAIVRSVIEAHGGTIAAGNGEGGGACFAFELPTNGRRSI